MRQKSKEKSPTLFRLFRLSEFTRRTQLGTLNSLISNQSRTPARDLREAAPSPIFLRADMITPATLAWRKIRGDTARGIASSKIQRSISPRHGNTILRAAGWKSAPATLPFVRFINLASAIARHRLSIRESSFSACVKRHCLSSRHIYTLKSLLKEQSFDEIQLKPDGLTETLGDLRRNDHYAKLNSRRDSSQGGGGGASRVTYGATPGSARARGRGW